MKAVQTDFLGDPNIGLFMKASDKLLLAGQQMEDKSLALAAEALGVKAVRAGVANSELVGIFCAMNSNGILLPNIALDSEVAAIRRAVKSTGMNVGVVDSDFTAIGNVILCNDRGAVLSRVLSREDLAVVKDCLGVECDYQTVAGLESVGSCGIATNRGCVLHRDASEEELDTVQDILKVETDIGTANFGSPFIGSCAIANGNGVVAGITTTGFEVSRMMEALKLI
ncbi:MAG: translation initiation factor IF-6 [Candidatus Aenigmarchaeota archaeon]|nr:translation initiation factor IF-6 [Candidatus Aenigmarchaeota archaeon]